METEPPIYGKYDYDKLIPHPDWNCLITLGVYHLMFRSGGKAGIYLVGSIMGSQELPHVKDNDIHKIRQVWEYADGTLTGKTSTGALIETEYIQVCAEEDLGILELVLDPPRANNYLPVLMLESELP